MQWIMKAVLTMTFGEVVSVVLIIGLYWLIKGRIPR